MTKDILKIEYPNNIIVIPSYNGFIPVIFLSNDIHDINGTLIADRKNSYKATRYNILELMASLKEEIDGMTNNVKRNLKSSVTDEYLQNIVLKLKDVQSAIDSVNEQE